MAYRSSGADNDGMVSNMKRFGVISSLSVEEGFRLVDRKYFVPKGSIRMAHTDQPIKEGNIHISAPHIYGVVVEALELPRNSAMTFLNAGSGTGYLTSIVASILGPKSSHYCVDIHADVIDHCKEAIANWKSECPAAREIQQIEIIHGNAVELDTQTGECALGFDRIYIGAAIECHQLALFKRLLKPGGILIGPVEAELIKVVRLHSPEYSEEFRTEILSAVRFANLLNSPKVKAVIPARVWNPTLHHYYPDDFRESCKALLLCSHAAYNQPLPVQPPPEQKVNASSMLPRALWLEILSYTHRDWFQAPLSEADVLRRRLQEEIEKAELANKARLEADARCHMAEKERDIYRLLALRAQRDPESNLALRHRIEEDMDTDALEEAATALLLGGGSLQALGFRDLFRRFRNQDLEFAGSDVEEEDEASYSDRMEEDDEDVEESTSEASLLARRIAARHENSRALVGARQIRAVSIAGEDI